VTWHTSCHKSQIRAIFDVGTHPEYHYGHPSFTQAWELIFFTYITHVYGLHAILDAFSAFVYGVL
jgi:hypothetical protein